MDEHKTECCASVHIHNIAQLLNDFFEHYHTRLVPAARESYRQLLKRTEVDRVASFIDFYGGLSKTLDHFIVMMVAAESLTHPAPGNEIQDLAFDRKWLPALVAELSGLMDDHKADPTYTSN